MSPMASQITSLTVAYSTVYSCTDDWKHLSSASLAFVWGIHRRPMNSPNKWPVTRKIFPFDDVIMIQMFVVYCGLLWFRLVHTISIAWLLHWHMHGYIIKTTLTNMVGYIAWTHCTLMIWYNHHNKIWHGKTLDDVIKWKLFPRYWPFLWWIHRSPVNFPHKGPVMRIFMFLWCKSV